MTSITTSTDPKALSKEIDLLLERYLKLLHQYTTLRTQLATVQSSIHQNIARANFNTDRGIRYGADCYDERMRATRVCRLTLNSGGDTKSESFNVSVVDKSSEEDTEGEQADGEEAEKTNTKAENAIPRDSIRMFGILVPHALRLAQGEAIKMVGNIIPRLASVDAEMKGVEIQIRRKRKHKAKAEALEAKSGNGELEKGTAVQCPG